MDTVFAKKTLKRAQPHLWRLRVTQMIFYQVRDSLPSRPSALEPFQHGFGHFRAAISVSVKGDTIVFLAKANRLSDIMQKATVCQAFTGCFEMPQGQERVLENIALRVMLGS